MNQKGTIVLASLAMAALLCLTACGQDGNTPGSSSQSSQPQGEISSSGDSSSSASQGASESQGPLSWEQAYEVALKDAGLTGDQTVLIKQEYELDDGVPKYELEFYGGGKKYEYEVHAETGAILKLDVEATGLDPSSITISQAQAKEIALAKVPGATDSDIRLELDVDDGHAIYEGKIVYQQVEYEFEIDAKTGTFLEWKMESIFD